MLLESVCLASCGLIAYHHVVYPVLLRVLTGGDVQRAPIDMQTENLPDVTLIIPAYNEARMISAKILNCAALEYQVGGLKIIVACDGCDDDTAARARATIAELGASRDVFEVIEFQQNRGKVAVLNDVIGHVNTTLAALSDVSAMLDPDAVRRAANHFVDARVGFVTGTYEVNARSLGLDAYWTYQKSIKRAEAALGAPVGAHGAFYVFRRSEWTELEPDTINDDVILPMRIVEKGYTGVYDEDISIREADRDTIATDLRRRRRLAAGALQQAIRLPGLADIRRPGLAFSFLSGKALRAFMPFIMVVALATNLVLAWHSMFWAALLALQLAFYALGWFGAVSEKARAMRPIAAISYLVRGHLNGLIGGANYLAGSYDKPWTRDKLTEDEIFMPAVVLAGKRGLDVVIASAAFIVFAVLLIPISIAIKLESKGPVFYRQLRVGMRTSTHSRLFFLTKFRTMRADAESRSGAVWASKNDPRITRVGNFLRKTRLDELPQCMDVLRGDMSIVGPRPERPQFFRDLEKSIPFYIERTFGLKPGITGLAQVNLPYDSSIEDVRAKVLYDHAYAMQLTDPGKWLAADISIMFRTFTVMVLGKGQ